MIDDVNAFYAFIAAARAGDITKQAEYDANLQARGEMSGIIAEVLAPQVYYINLEAAAKLKDLGMELEAVENEQYRITHAALVEQIGAGFAGYLMRYAKDSTVASAAVRG